jgi:uncharacterized protein
MYFGIAGIEVEPWIPPLVSFVISFFTSTGGVSGAFLLLPFQMSVLGFTSPAVSPTNQLYNVVAIPGGVYRYIKEGRMVWPLTWIVVIGTLPGVFIGAWLRIIYLPDPATFKVFAGFVLLYIGIRLIMNITKKKVDDKGSSESRFAELVKNFKSQQESNISSKLPRIKVKEFSLKKVEYEFYGESYSVPMVKISIISFIVGIVGGAYGIGGGAVMAPLFVAFFNLPVYTVAGAALMGTLITSIAGVAFYQLLAPFYPGMSIAPDWLLGFLFGIGGLLGTYFGARFQKHLPANAIKWILSGAIVFLAVKYIISFF